MEVVVSSTGGLFFNSTDDLISLADDSGIVQDAYEYLTPPTTTSAASLALQMDQVTSRTSVEPMAATTIGLDASGGFFGGCSSGGDSDSDGIPDDIDNCPNTQNAGQEDCDGDGVGDACETGSSDCNSNGIPDSCDIDDQTSGDCNTNGVPDECDLIDGTLEDNNGNSVPDSCEVDVPADVYINEVRRDEPGPDNNDYVEVRGPSGQSMDGISLIIIGDGAWWIWCGRRGHRPQRSGGWQRRRPLICADTFTLGPIALADLVPEGGVNLENSDNITLALVTNFGSLSKIWIPTTTAPWTPPHGLAWSTRSAR